MIRPALRRSIFAVRIGIDTRPTPGTDPVAACKRCGRYRHVQASRPVNDLCSDCKTVDPSFGRRKR